MTEQEWPLWEVFVQLEGGAPHEHAGSVRAPDKTMAVQNARDVYSRRGKVVNLWIVAADQIVATSATDADSMFRPSDDKIYRHPHFYKVPRGIKAE
ncbi:MAG: 1,2-phenylacetyl-CoA epoxidase subunit B [Proteobacteria bacterium]|nr:1,2-phenylacetyl-CoA epoxidase subunit B [Pseudomonadota bacterium]